MKNSLKFLKSRMHLILHSSTVCAPPVETNLVLQVEHLIWEWMLGIAEQQRIGMSFVSPNSAVTEHSVFQ